MTLVLVAGCRDLGLPQIEVVDPQGLWNPQSLGGADSIFQGFDQCAGEHFESGAAREEPTDRLQCTPHKYETVQNNQDSTVIDEVRLLRLSWSVQ